MRLGGGWGSVRGEVMAAIPAVDLVILPSHLLLEGISGRTTYNVQPGPSVHRCPSCQPFWPPSSCLSSLCPLTLSMQYSPILSADSPFPLPRASMVSVTWKPIAGLPWLQSSKTKERDRTLDSGEQSNSREALGKHVWPCLDYSNDFGKSTLA